MKNKRINSNLKINYNTLKNFLFIIKYNVNNLSAEAASDSTYILKRKTLKKLKKKKLE